jgi:hypothetical protein
VSPSRFAIVLRSAYTPCEPDHTVTCTPVALSGAFRTSAIEHDGPIAACMWNGVS